EPTPSPTDPPVGDEPLGSNRPGASRGRRGRLECVPMAKPKTSPKTSSKATSKGTTKATKKAAAMPPSTGLDTTSGDDSERPPLAPGVKYRRILLKLSGEALMGEQGFGIDA